MAENERLGPTSGGETPLTVGFIPKRQANRVPDFIARRDESNIAGLSGGAIAVGSVVVATATIKTRYYRLVRTDML